MGQRGPNGITGIQGGPGPKGYLGSMGRPGPNVSCLCWITKKYKSALQEYSKY